MIAKHVPIRSLKKSDFANLANYITDQQSKIERVGYIAFNNCESVNLDMAISEILAVQQMNTRTQNDKTYHLIVSFRAGENPSKDILNDVEKTICKDLGFSKEDRCENIRRLFNVGRNFVEENTIVLMSVINPYVLVLAHTYVSDA